MMEIKMDNQTTFQIILSFLGDNPIISILTSAVGISFNFIESISTILSFIILICSLIIVILTVWDKIEKRLLKIKIKKNRKT